MTIACTYPILGERDVLAELLDLGLVVADGAGDLTLLVPPGTIVIDEASGLALKDLAAPGDWIVAAKGGGGGWGGSGAGGCAGL